MAGKLTPEMKQWFARAEWDVDQMLADGALAEDIVLYFWECDPSSPGRKPDVPKLPGFAAWKASQEPQKS